MKRHGTTVILLMAFIVGLSLLLYPTFADWWNSMHQSRAVATYVDQVTGIDEDLHDQMWNAAGEYNTALLNRTNSYMLTDTQKAEYNKLLDVGGTGIMSYIEIPAIGVTLPVYHGTDEAVLQVAVGHLEWSSLPVGGESTHCVISGHTGLPSAKLFTNLNRLVEGDIFMLRTLDETLTYEIDQVLIVLPYETSALQIEEGKDYCTLVTCTPYGVNSHRLLVRGHRIENQKEARVVRVTSNAMLIKPILVAPVLAAPLLLVFLVSLFIPRKSRNRRGGDKFEDI